MFIKYLTTTSLVAAVAFSPISIAPAQAQDAGDVIGGALLGGLIGYGIAQSQQPRTTIIQPNDPRHPQYDPNYGNRPAPPPGARPAPPQAGPAPYNPPRRVVRPAIPATEAGRQVQTALNYFGFDAGYVDGQVGPATRAAVQRYQAALGYPVDGNSFPEPQAQYLIGAYLWATNGGQGQTGLSGTSLLAAYRGVLNGTTPAATAGYNGQPGPNTTIVVNPGTTTVVPAPGAGAPVTTAAAPGGAVPNLFANSGTSPILSSRCDAVALQGQANGGMMTLGNLTNPAFALSEQFCTARASAVNQGHDLTEAIPGLSYTQIHEQCVSFSNAVASQTALIGTTVPGQTVAAAQGFAYSTGIPQAELAGTARVCLGVGYGDDNMEMALGSALMLVASGEPAYGELLGHHLREGVGVEQDDYRAHAWYEASLAAVQAGAPAVFSPADAGRLPLIRQAVAITLGSGQPTTPVPAAVTVPVIPGAATFAPQNVVIPQPQPQLQPVRPAPVAVNPEPINIQPNAVLPSFQTSQPNIEADPEEVTIVPLSR